ncbi:MAG: AzlD domain-containing protein [Anaerolineae bacterium]|nr:AzlD domain-containing protein [Anaerolineae bacterium]
MNEALLVLGMALVTFLIRYPMLAIVGRLQLPDWLIRALRYVPVAVLTAIIMPIMLLPNGELDLRPSNAFLVGGIAAGIIAWRTKNLLLTIVLGMAIFLLWRALIGG